jgi:GTP-binding protein
MSEAKPKIADYPFTTLQPNLGVVESGEVRYTIADVPGLIEGASEGKGLGLEFLRHVERCHVLVHVIDAATNDPGRDPVSDYDTIITELSRYQLPGEGVPLQDRPALVVLNKVDVPEAKELAEMVTQEFADRGLRVFPVSAVSREGLKEWGFAMSEIVAQSRGAIEQAPVETARVIRRPRAVDDAGFEILREGRSDGVLFRVRGDTPEKFVQQTDFDNDEAVGYLSDRLAALGLDDALYDAGATPGDAVVIGPTDQRIFDWEPTISAAGYAARAPRGDDDRLDDDGRLTRRERKERYHERMDSKAAAREELEEERHAGLWADDSHQD